MLAIRSEKNAVLLPIKVVPGASRTRLMGEWDGRLKIAVAAPAEKGKANRAVLALLAARLGVRRKALQIVAGETSPEKTIRIADITAAAVGRILGAARR